MGSRKMTLVKWHAWPQWRHRHREQTCGPGEGSGEEGEGGCPER